MPKSSEPDERVAQKTRFKSINLKNLLSVAFTKIPSIIKCTKGSASRSHTLINYPDDNISAAHQPPIFQKLSTFCNKVVQEAMIPKSDVPAVKYTINSNKLIHDIATICSTRTLIYEDTLDNIIGFIHIKDVFKCITKEQKFVIANLIKKPIISAPSMKLIDLLSTMQEQHIYISIVVDEYGGTDGIVTIESIMEEMIGPIDDEHYERNEENNSYQIVDSKTILASGRVEVEELERVLNIKLKKEGEEFDTIGGLVLAHVGHVPSPGTKIVIADNIELEVLDANLRILKKVKLTLNHA